MNRYPLSWPSGWPRFKERKSAKFGKARRFEGSGETHRYIASRPLTVSEGVARVLKELALLGVLDGDGIISTNVPTRLDGLPRGDQREPSDPGAAVYWKRPEDKAPKVMAIDIYDRVADNLAAIAATLEAMRAIERHGGAQILERAFTGFDALPAPGQTAARGWRELFGFGSLPATMADVEAMYKALRSRNHPDKGGSAEAFHEVQTAYEQAKQELRA